MYLGSPELADCSNQDVDYELFGLGNGCSLLTLDWVRASVRVWYINSQSWFVDNYRIDLLACHFRHHI